MAYEVLTAAEVRVVQALGRAIFPDNGRLPSADEADLVGYIDRYLTWIPASERALVRVMFAAFGANVLLVPRSRRGDWIAAWENSRIYYRRVLFQALRSVFTLAYFSNPEVERRMGVQNGAAILARQAREAKAAVAAMTEAAEAAEAEAPAPVAEPVVDSPPPKAPRGAKKPARKPAAGRGRKNPPNQVQT